MAPKRVAPAGSDHVNVTSAPLRGRLAAPLVVALIWGVNVPLMKAGLTEFDPFVFNALRLSLSAVALGVVDAFERRGRRGVPSQGTPWRFVVGFGLLSSLLYQVMFLVGMDATSASNTALIIASGPLWTAILSRLYGLERFTPRTLAALAVTLTGTLLVTTGGAASDADSGSLFGNVIVLAAMLTWAWATVLSRPVLEWFPATRLAYLSTLVALPAHWALALPRLDEIDVARPGFATTAVVYSGVLSTGVAYALWNRSVRELGPARTATFSYLVPVVALTVAWWFLGERPAGLQIAGGFLVIAGLSARSRLRRPGRPVKPRGRATPD